VIPAFLSWCDAGVADCLFPLALLILISGLDDLALDAIYLWAWATRRFPAVPAISVSDVKASEKTIAIFVPLWHEHAVIAGMVEHNVAAVNYGNYHFFIGAYPNDDPTLDAVRDLETRFPHVHLAVCPHNGPTSKADCLNWIYQRMLLFEEHHGTRFDIVVSISWSRTTPRI
jgi:bacteriophage N4 adsorption protein B